MAAGASSVWMLNQSSFLGSCQQLSSVSKLVASRRPRPAPPSLFIVEASTRPRTKREDRTARHSRIRKKVLLLPLSFIFNLSSPLSHYSFIFLVLSIPFLVSCINLSKSNNALFLGVIYVEILFFCTLIDWYQIDFDIILVHVVRAEIFNYLLHILGLET